MPYKNPERKRQWEREHRSRRNEQRRVRRLQTNEGSVARTPVPDPVSGERRKSGWTGIFAFGAAIALVVIVAFSGIGITNLRDIAEASADVGY